MAIFPAHPFYFETRYRYDGGVALLNVHTRQLLFLSATDIWGASSCVWGTKRILESSSLLLLLVDQTGTDR